MPRTVPESCAVRLPALSPRGDAIATDLNDRGQVVGHGTRARSRLERALLWDPATG